MKIKLALLASFCLFAFPALAIMDGTPDLFGLYFDENADINCVDGVTPFSQQFVYAIYTNPTVPEIIGYEFGVDFSSNLIVLSTLNPWNPWWDPIENPRYALYWGYPVEMQQVNILMTFTVLYTDVNLAEATFSMREADPPAGEAGQPGVILPPDGFFHPVNVLNGIGNVTAGINMDCGLQEARATWGTVKALYR